MNGIDNNRSLLEGLGLTKVNDAAKKSQLGQDEFLRLMLTQLNNQDPLKPMEGGEFLTQIAQFTQASGIQELQQSFASLSASLSSNQALQASTLVGRTVLVSGGTGLLPVDGALQGAVDVPSSTSALRVGIYSQSGELVRTIELGTQQAGVVPFEWDGKAQDGTRLPAGRYDIKAEINDGGQTFAASTLVSARVESVTLGGAGQGLTINLAGLGPMDFSAVREIM